MQYSDELKSRVRVLTDYDTVTLSDEDLTTILDIARSEVEAVVIGDTGDNSVTADIDWTVYPAENALFWTSCLFSKIKAGEIDGVPMSLGDMEVEALRTQGRDNESVIWFRRANKYANETAGGISGSPSGVGHRSGIGRHGYSDEPTSFYD